MEYNGTVSYSLTFDNPTEDFSFFVCPNMNCGYNETFKIDILLLHDGTENILSEDYMMDYAFLNEARSLRVKNLHREYQAEQEGFCASDVFFATSPDNYEQSFIIPTDSFNYKNSFSNYYTTTDSTIDLSALLSLPETPDNTGYLTFVVANGEFLTCFDGSAFCFWQNGEKSVKFNFNVNLQNGLNKLYTVTLFEKDGRIQRIVSRATVNRIERFVYAEEFAVSYAFNGTASIFAFQNQNPERRCWVHVYTYGFNFDDEYSKAAQSFTRNSKFEMDVSEQETVTVHTLSLNTGMIAYYAQEDDEFIFAKYKAYGYTN